MDFTELYAQKKMTADQAAALVKSGDWVDYGWAVNTPVAVDAELAKRPRRKGSSRGKTGHSSNGCCAASVVRAGPELHSAADPGKL